MREVSTRPVGSQAWVRAAIVLGVLAGCLAGGVGSVGAQITLEVLSGESDPNSVAAIKEVANQLQAKHPNVTVQPQFATWGDLYKRTVAAIAAGAPPAIVLQSDSPAVGLLEQDVLTPMDDLVNQLGREDFFPRALSVFTKDGKVYGVPSIWNYTIVWYRSDLYEKYGLKAATTWEEFERNVRTITERTRQEGNVVYGIGLPLGTSSACQDELFHDFVWSNGVTILDRQGNVTFNTPEVTQALEFIKQLAASAPPDSATYSHLDPLTAFTAGKTAHVIYGGRLMTYLQRNKAELLEKIDAFLVPKGPSARGRHASFNALKGWIVPKQSAERTALAKEFIALMESRQNALRWLQAVPLHHLPARRSLSQSKEFWDVPLASTRAGKAVVRLASEATDRYGLFATYAAGERNANVSKVLEAFIPCKSVQQVAVGRTSAAEAAKRGEQEIRQLLGK